MFSRGAAGTAVMVAVLAGAACGGRATSDPEGADEVDPSGGAAAGDTSGGAVGGAAGGTAGADGHGGAGEDCVAPMRQSGCFGTPICPSYWCPEARHLRLARISEAECVFVITDTDLPEHVNQGNFLVALVLPSADGSADAEELLSALGGDISACAARLSENDEAWLLDSTGNQLTVTVCPCVCDRMGQEGWLDVVYGCGGGPYYTG